MACNDPYQNPAGLKFVTRVEIGSNDPLWPDGLAYGEDRLILNIPNGAGPGTVLLQTENCYMDWRTVGTKNLVRSTQRAYTGVSSWEEVWLEDGGNIYGRVQGRSVAAYNVDGILEGPIIGVESKLRALWFPNSTRIPTFDRLSIVSGPTTPASPGGFPVRTIGSPGTTSLTPPGLCRFFQVSMGNGQSFGLNILYGNGPAAYWASPGQEFEYGCCPAWGTLHITNLSVNPADFAVCWNRYPMTRAIL